MKLLRKFIKGFDHILDILASFSGIIIVMITIGVCVNVMMKYFFNQPIIGVEEITEQLLLFITFFGSAWLLRKEGHVSVDFLVVRLDPKTQAFLGFITSLFGIIISIALTWYGWKVTWINFIKKEYFPTILELPKAPIFIFIPLGSFLLLIQFIRRSVQNLKKFIFPEETYHPNVGN